MLPHICYYKGHLHLLLQSGRLTQRHQIDHSIPRPFTHPSANPPGSTNLHTLLSITYIALLSDRVRARSRSTDIPPLSFTQNHHIDVQGASHPAQPTSAPAIPLYMVPICPFCAQSSVQACANSESSGCSFLAGWLILRWSWKNPHIPFRRMTKVEDKEHMRYERLSRRREAWTWVL